MSQKAALADLVRYVPHRKPRRFRKPVSEMHVEVARVDMESQFQKGIQRYWKRVEGPA